MNTQNPRNDTVLLELALAAVETAIEEREITILDGKIKLELIGRVVEDALSLLRSTYELYADNRAFPTLIKEKD